jgi:chaperonin GroEL
MKTIASNAGVEGAVIVGKVEELEDPSMGYDAATGEEQREQWKCS